MRGSTEVPQVDLSVGAQGFGTGEADKLTGLLNSYERFRTKDPALAENELGVLTAPQRLRVLGDESTFDAIMSIADFGSVSLCLLRLGAEVTSDAPPQGRFVTVLVPLTGTIAVGHQGQEFIATPGRTHVVLSEGTSTHMRWSSDCVVIFLRAETEALRSEVAGMLPGAGLGSLRFAPQVESASSRMGMLGAMHLLGSALTSEGLAPPPTAQRHLRKHALTTMLLGLEHSYSAALRDPTPLISNRAVRRAIDVIQAEEAAQITVTDIAREAGISLRALEMGFRNEVGMPPSQYLRKVRLHRARGDLLAADTTDHVTVAGIATDWGFGHAGRFSQAYRAEFGESPAATLRRRRP